jgi:hypothetical protein
MRAEILKASSSFCVAVFCSSRGFPRSPIRTLNYCGTRTQISPGFRTSPSGSKDLAMNHGLRSFNWLSIQIKGIYLTPSVARLAVLILLRRGCCPIVI